jgi:hypothetical protein
MLRDSTHSGRDDDEPLAPWPASTLSIRAVRRRCAGVFYCTKPRNLWELEEQWPPITSWDVVSLYGVPTARDLDLVAVWAKHRGTGIRFVGDLDPLDLTVYLVLAIGLGRRGVTARLAARYGDWLRWSRKSCKDATPATLHQSQSEQRQCRKLLALPVDWPTLLDRDALALLKSARKLEVEGVVNRASYPKHHLRRIGRSLCRPDAGLPSVSK